MLVENREMDTTVSTIKRWFDAKKFSNVRFEEINEPYGNERNDYLVKKVLKFNSDNLDQMYVEIWVTDKLSIGVGIENWARILRRVGKTVNSDRFVIGHEPIPMKLESIIMLLNLISSGSISFSIHGISIFNLYRFKAWLSKDDFKRLEKSGYYVMYYFETLKRFNDEKLLRYDPWN